MSRIRLHEASNRPSKVAERTPSIAADDEAHGCAAGSASKMEQGTPAAVTPPVHTHLPQEQLSVRFLTVLLCAKGLVGRTSCITSYVRRLDEQLPELCT
jgi:hypothetical protein